MNRLFARSLVVAVLSVIMPSATFAQIVSLPSRPILQSDPLPEGAVRRLGTNRLRVSGPVGYFMFSPDGSTLMVGAQDGVHFWETKTWRETWRTNAMAFSCSPDGKHVAKQTSERVIEIWDVDKKALVHARPVNKLGRNVNVFDLEFNAKGDRLWLGISGQGCWLFDWAKNEVVQRISQPDLQESSLCQSRDRKVLALRRNAERLMIYDGVDGKLKRELRIDPESTWHALNHDGTIAAVGKELSAMTFWSVATGKELQLLPANAEKAAEAPANVGPVRFSRGPLFDTTGKHLIVTGVKLAVVDIAKRTTIAEAAYSSNFPSAIGLNHDSSMLAVGYSDGTVELRDPLTLRPLMDDPHPRGPALGVAFSRDGRSLATHHAFSLMGEVNDVVRLWNLQTGANLKTFDKPSPEAALPRSLSLRADRILALASKGSWNLDTGAFTPGKSLAAKQRLLRVSADGLRGVAVVESEIGDVQSASLIEIGTGRELLKLPLESPPDMAIPGRTIAASLSADGSVVAIRSRPASRNDPLTGEIREFDGSLVAWNVTSGRAAPLVSITFDHALDQFAVSADGQLLIVHGLREAAAFQQLWHLPTGYPLWKVKDEKAVRSILGQQVDEETRMLLELSSEPMPQASLAFSHDNRFLASGAEGEIVIRETLTGAIVGAFKGQDGWIEDLVFSPDSQLLASASSASSVMLWKVPPFGAAKPGVWRRADADTLWDNLRGEPVRAFQAMADLHAGGEEAVLFLKDRLQAESDRDRLAIKQALADLGSTQFQAREKATARLDKWGFRLKPYLVEALAHTADLEQKRRLSGLLLRSKNSGIEPEELRVNRSVVVLERIGSPGARVVLEALARGHANDLTVRSARASLARMEGRE
jgi:WD40 repeat protein